MTETIRVDACPTCGGPAQFIDDCGKGGDCDCTTAVRSRPTPNIQADLGGGWRLVTIEAALGRDGYWEARASRKTGSRRRGAIVHEYARASGETPSEAYLRLRSTTEERRR